MITRKQYEVMHNWNERKTFATFGALYKYGFEYRHLWWRPLWRVWRIFRNTYILKLYQKIYELPIDKLK